MRGGVNHQITTIFNKSGIFEPGTSRHEAKQEIKSELSRQGISASSQNIASHSSLYSYSSSSDYKDTWHELGRYSRQELGLKDMSKMDYRHIQSYLEKRIQDGISYGSWRKEASHLNKWGEALRRFDGQDRNIGQAINDLRDLAKQSLEASTKDHGGFNRPQDVISKIAEKNERYELAARVQYEGGARLREATLIKQDQLKGLQRDELTGRQVGVVHLTDTKGGKQRDIQISPDTYKKLENATKNEAFRINEGSYRNAVNEAAKAAQEPRTGTHDFRYNYAQGRVNEIIRFGHSGEQAIQAVSWEMGHERADITNLYLR